MRPEGFENPYPVKEMAPLFDFTVAEMSPEAEAFEAGADYMVEMLRKSGVRKAGIQLKGVSILPDGPDGNFIVSLDEDGTWVFIPDDD